MSSPRSAPRPARADRVRNRERIVQAARDAFARADADDETLSMNEVARVAGVGVATLYRHFATREELAGAVYVSKLDELTALVVDSSRDRTGLDALRSWVTAFARFMLATRGMMDTLRGSWLAGPALTSEATDQIESAIRQLLDRGVQDGSVRSALDAPDVTVGVLALLSTTPPGSGGARALRLLDLFVDGLASS